MCGTSASPGRDPASSRHASVVFSTDQEWAGHLVAFVRAGLEQGEQVQYFADTTDPDRVLRTLDDGDVDTASAVRRGQLIVTTAAQTYLAGPRFDPDAMIGLWEEAVETALARGHPGLRAIGEMSWCARETAGADRLLEYELRIHQEVFERLPLTAWCFYDDRLLPRDDLAVLVGAHPTRLGAAVPADGGTGLRVTPTTDFPGFRLSGPAGYESRRVTASVAAALPGSRAAQVTLDLSDLQFMDVDALTALARAAAGRNLDTPVRLLDPPPSLKRMLELFPELGSALEVVGR
ncbi:MEDS domain-containing protein [Streptomyces sp. NPDC052701]|uniref:MEDS domain-containing protein n=1 Tax=Streptomyces sp. NPDC052701 TaxID=3155533 RepID=UPI00343FC929